MVELLALVFRVLYIAILVRVLYSWIDPSPYPDNELKRILWLVTEPILEPLRRVIPPIGMIDISPLVALVLLSAVERALVGSLGY